jgi:hypothetical protein
VSGAGIAKQNSSLEPRVACLADFFGVSNAVQTWR